MTHSNTYLLATIIICSHIQLHSEPIEQIIEKSYDQDANYVKNYKCIEKEYNIAGVKKLLKLVSATNDQIYWITCKEEELLQQKKLLENECLILQEAATKVHAKQEYYNAYYNMMSAADKVAHQNELEDIVNQLIEEKNNLSFKLNRIAVQMNIINYALDMQQALIFEVKPDGSYFSQKKIFIHIQPIRLEISALKEEYEYSKLMIYYGKENMMQPQEREEYKQKKKNMYNKLLTLLKKAEFYTTQANNLFMPEAQELVRIQDELSFLLQTLL